MNMNAVANALTLSENRVRPQRPTIEVVNPQAFMSGASFAVATVAVNSIPRLRPQRPAIERATSNQPVLGELITVASRRVNSIDWLRPQRLGQKDHAIQDVVAGAHP